MCQHPRLREQLKEKYTASDLVWNDSNRVLSGQELLNFLEGADRAIVGLEKVDRALIGALPKLKHLSKYGVGLDGVDLRALSENGKTLGWTAGVNRLAVAELALTFLLMGARALPQSLTNVRLEKWVRAPGRQLTSRKIGIIGCGNVGKELVKLLHPFQCEILVHDIKPDLDFFKQYSLRSCSLSEIFLHAELITIHVPLNHSTRGLISEREFQSLKMSPFLVNTARGGIVDERALLAALDGGSLSGAALDVLEEEPPQRWDLAKHGRVILTPHLGGNSEEAVQAMGQAAIQNLENFQDPLNYVQFT